MTPIVAGTGPTHPGPPRPPAPPTPPPRGRVRTHRRRGSGLGYLAAVAAACYLSSSGVVLAFVGVYLAA